MRQTYHIRLDALGDQGARMCGSAGLLLKDATTSLLTANLSLAENVIRAGADVDRQRADLEEIALELLTLQSPVASDLRMVVTAFWIVRDLQRMAALAIHVAETAARRHPNVAVPPAVRSIIAGMAEIGSALATKTQLVLSERELALAESVPTLDRDMDLLQTQIFAAVNSPAWTADAAAAVDAAMLGRFYERFGDHCVAISQRVIFLVTGDRLAADVRGPYSSRID